MPGDYGRRGRARRRRIDAARREAATAQFFLCGRCRAQVLICSHCDRGQIYCGKRGSGGAAKLAARRWPPLPGESARPPQPCTAGPTLPAA